jgi:hypothetical protein
MTTPDSDARAKWTLIGIVAGFAVVNSVISLVTTEVEPWAMIRDAIAYVLVVLEPIMFGIWAALGDGSILKRLFVTIPCLLLLSLVPGYVPEAFSDVRKDEFVMMMVVGFAIYAIAVGLFLVFRWFTGFRIVPAGDGSMTVQSKIRFSLNDLIGITSLWAVVLGLTIHLKFQTTPDPNTWIFGPDFYLKMLIFGGALLSARALPTLAVPMFMLHGRPSRFAVVLVAFFWTAVSLTMIVLQYMDGHFFEAVVTVAGYQLITAAIGALVAFVLRFGGFRLTRPTRKNQKTEVADAPV